MRRVGQTRSILLNQAISVPPTRRSQDRISCWPLITLPSHRQFGAAVSPWQVHKDWSPFFSDHQKFKPVHIPLQSVKKPTGKASHPSYQKNSLDELSSSNLVGLMPRVFFLVLGTGVATLCWDLLTKVARLNHNRKEVCLNEEYLLQLTGPCRLGLSDDPRSCNGRRRWKSRDARCSCG